MSRVGNRRAIRVEFFVTHTISRCSSRYTIANSSRRAIFAPTKYTIQKPIMEAKIARLPGISTIVDMLKAKQTCCVLVGLQICKRKAQPVETMACACSLVHALFSKANLPCATRIDASISCLFTLSSPRTLHAPCRNRGAVASGRIGLLQQHLTSLSTDDFPPHLLGNHFSARVRHGRARRAGFCWRWHRRLRSSTRRHHQDAEGDMLVQAFRGEPGLAVPFHEARNPSRSRSFLEPLGGMSAC